jgi:hypothetical protein
MSYLSKNLICFFAPCKYRGDEGQCEFSGTIIISLEGDCQCMEQKISISCSIIQNLGKEIKYGAD